MTVCKICGKEVSRIRLHLRSHYVDPMDYWVWFYSETHEYPKCKYCGAFIDHFINDSFENGPSKYCSKKCMDADLPNVLKERHANGIYEGTSYLTTKWNYDVDHRLTSLARTSFHRLFREADPLSEGYFYVLVLNNDSIKFGATRQELNYYINLRYHCIDYEVIRKYKSTLLNVAHVELLIKTNKFSEYHQEGYMSSTEELNISILNELIEYLDKVPFFEKL